MFERIEPAPRDPILGLTEAFQEDPNPKKINLSVGVYQDATGKTPILESVREAGKLVLERQKSMSYLPIPGSPAYAAAVQRLMFGEGHEVETSGRAATSHTPGGTGALRVAADFIHQQLPKATVWMTQPTWPNHPQIFAAAGVPTKSFPVLRRQDQQPGVRRGDRRDSKRFRPATSSCCTAAATTRPASTRRRTSGRSWPTRCTAAACCRCWTSPTRASPTAFAKTPAACWRLLPAGRGADGVQLVLQELWPLLRARRRADDRRQGQGGGRHGAEPGEGRASARTTRTRRPTARSW